MKKNTKKTIKFFSTRVAYFTVGTICGVAVLIGAYGVWSADFSAHQANQGERLTHTKWNNMLDSIKSEIDQSVKGIDYNDCVNVERPGNIEQYWECPADFIKIGSRRAHRLYIGGDQPAVIKCCKLSR